MGDEEDLMERKRTLENDRREQARWLESLNLYAEALRIYSSINDDENIRRVKGMMIGEYGKNALRLEEEGRFQDAANLYYLIGDHEGVRRMKERRPDLVILYDAKDGGLAKLAKGLDDLEKGADRTEYFSKPNTSPDAQPLSTETLAKVGQSPSEKRTVPVKMPKNRKSLAYCPYCGEKMITKKEPRFCPFCGEELQ